MRQLFVPLDSLCFLGGFIIVSGITTVYMSKIVPEAEDNYLLDEEWMVL